MRFALPLRAESASEPSAPIGLVVAVFAIGVGYLAQSKALFLTVFLAATAASVLAPIGVVAAVPAVVGLTYEPLRAGGAEFSPAETLIVALVTGVALRAAITLSRLGLAPTWTRAVALAREQARGFALPALGLLLAGSLSLLTLAMPAYRHESLRYYRWVVLEPLLYFMLARHYLRDRRGRWLAAGSFVAGGFFVALSGLADLARGGGVSVEGVRRISGVYPHPNALALFVERPLVFAVVLALAYQRRASLWWLGPAGLLGIVLLFTYSRGALLAVAAAILVALWLVGRRRLALGALGLAVLGGLAITATATARVVNLFSGGSGSLRLDLWRSSLAMLRDHPIFGIGLDQFLYVYAPRYVLPAAWSERFTSHPHDIILDLWLSLGILGLAVAAMFAVLLIRQGRRVLVLRSGVGVACLAVILAGTLHGLVDNGYFLPDLALIFWFMAALIDVELYPESG